MWYARLLLMMILALCGNKGSSLLAMEDFYSGALMGSGQSGHYETLIAPGSSYSGSVVTGNYTWTSGQAVSWSMSYAASTGLLSFTWAIGTSQARTISSTFTDSLRQGLMVSAITSSDVWSNSKVDVTNLSLTYSGGILAGSDLHATGPNKDVVTYFNPQIMGNWTLTGKTTMTWYGGSPSDYDLFFYVGNYASPVPEPSTWLLLGSCFMISFLVARKRPACYG